MKVYQVLDIIIIFIKKRPLAGLQTSFACLQPLSIYIALTMAFAGAPFSRADEVPPFLIASAKAQKAYSDELNALEKKNGSKISNAEKESLKQKYFGGINRIAASDASAAQQKISSAAKMLFKGSKSNSISSVSEGGEETNSAQAEAFADVGAKKTEKAGSSQRTPSSSPKTNASRVNTTGSENVESGGADAISFSR